MKSKILFTLFFSALISLQNVLAQTYCMPPSGNQTITSSTGNFYDSGCAGLNYSNNENGTMTICPTATACVTSLTFSSMALADATDILRIYSGIGTGNPLLQTFQGPVNTTSFSLLIVSQDASGCLTALFQSGSSGVTAGWVATIGCNIPTALNEIYTANLSGSYIAADLAGNNFLNINLSSPSSFTTTIFSVDGKKVSEKNYSLAGGQHKIFLQTENLPQGIYFCRVEGENVNKAFKFIKQ